MLMVLEHTRISKAGEGGLSQLQMNMADKYESLGNDYHWQWLGRARHYVAWIVNCFAHIPYEGNGASVLDFGCGDGVPAWFMTNRGYEVYGYDVLGGPLDVARRKILGVTFSTVYPDNRSFDYVVAIGVLEHMENPGLLVDAVLRAKEFSLITVVNPDVVDKWGLEKEYTRDGLVELFVGQEIELAAVGPADRLYIARGSQ